MPAREHDARRRQRFRKTIFDSLSVVHGRLVPFRLCLTKQYNITTFLDDLRLMYKTAGQQRKKATFIFTDSQIKDENFLELLNSLILEARSPASSRKMSCKSWPEIFNNSRPKEHR